MLSHTHSAALAYVGRGIPVFPVTATGTYKVPATANGLLDATTDRAIIERWWATNSNYNIGIATGAKATFWVLDIDGQDGAASLAALEAQHGPLPETPEQATARGRHICFAYDPARPIRNRAGVPGAGIDVRGDGGYIVAAPSKHATGIQYKWHVDRRPSKMAFALAPEWLLSLVEKKAPALRLVPPSPPATRAAGRLITPYGERALRAWCKITDPQEKNRRESNNAAIELATL